MNTKTKLKIFNKLPVFIKTRIFLYKMPHSFIIEATNVCNQRCPACPWHSVMKRRQEFLSFDGFKNLFSKVEKYAQAISFYLMGEPFLNKDIFKMISVCKEKEIKTLISSNAMLIGNHIDEILSSDLTTLQMTLDGWNPETHEKYRVGSRFETVRDNIKKISEEKKRRGLEKPILHIQTLLFRRNKNEIKDIERFAREIGVNHYSVKAPSISVGYDEEKRKEFADDFMIKDDGFEKYDRTASKSDEKFYKNQPFCPQLTQCVVLVNGDVVPCCFDYDGKVKFGNLYNESIEDIWRGKNRKKFIESFLKKTNQFCEKCDMMNDRGLSIF
ncbi:MAG: radical SAM protein [Parcubacteria group bacterium]|nr:radical SAM protein [Parcubacteria group bacterium]